MQFARRVKVLPPQSPYFSVTSKTSGNKVAAGMEATFAITFTPDSDADFAWDLVVCTEREKFIVPIRARGARGRLELTTAIEFGSACPCKVQSKRSVLMRNVGRRSTRFQLSAQPPFAIAPREATLAVGESLQCAMLFTPTQAGPAQGALHIAHDNGDADVVPVHGHGLDVDVAVEPTAVTFLDTFVTKMSQRTFRVVNNTSVPAPFALKRFATPAEEAAAARAEAATLVLQHAPAGAALLKSLPPGDHATLAEQQAMLWDTGQDPEEAAGQQRRYQRLLTQTMAQKYLFESGAVAAFPLEGTVPAHSSIEVRCKRVHFSCLCRLQQA